MIKWGSVNDFVNISQCVVLSSSEAFLQNNEYCNCPRNHVLVFKMNFVFWCPCKISFEGKSFALKKKKSLKDPN